MKLKICTMCLCLGLVYHARSQMLVSFAGNEFQDDEISLSWSLGENIIETVHSDNIIMTQGFQQAYDFRSTVINEASNHPSFTIFPNPTLAEVHLALQGDFESGKIMIYDMNGQLIQENRITQRYNHMDVSHLTPGIYILSVDQGGLRSNEKFIKLKN